MIEECNGTAIVRAAVLILLSAGRIAAARPPHADRPPNVDFILAEDLGSRIGGELPAPAAGSRLTSTPGAFGDLSRR
jgi:hypothetical protein